MTAADKPCVGRAGYTDADLGRVLDAPPAGEADKPRADLVALLLQFEGATASRDRRQSLYLSGNEEGAAVRAWADLRGYRVQAETRTRSDSDGRRLAYTSLTVEEAADWASWTVTCSLHDDHEVTAQADQQVLARIAEAFDAARDEDGNRIMDQTEIEAREGKEQPEAAGSV